MLVAGHIDVDVSGLFTLGDIAVGGGTIALAWVTWRLAKLTAALDQRNASRERKRREREVRGVARLIDGELDVVRLNVDEALTAQQWFSANSAPHGAWDRDGALIAESVPEDEALALIRLFAKLDRWDRLARLEQSDPRFPIALVPNDTSYPETTLLNEILIGVDEVRPYLRRLAYPDARELEPDPDDELAYRQRRRWRRLHRG